MAAQTLSCATTTRRERGSVLEKWRSMLWSMAPIPGPALNIWLQRHQRSTSNSAHARIWSVGEGSFGHQYRIFVLRQALWLAATGITVWPILISTVNNVYIYIHTLQWYTNLISSGLQVLMHQECLRLIYARRTIGPYFQKRMNLLGKLQPRNKPWGL